MAWKKTKGIELSVFKGREAKLNRAIFQTLATKGPQTIYDIHKATIKRRGLRHTRYASVNKRIRILEEAAYVRKIAVKETKAGFEASIYDATAKAYLATLLSRISLEALIARVDETSTTGILAALLSLKAVSKGNRTKRLATSKTFSFPKALTNLWGERKRHHIVTH